MNQPKYSIILPTLNGAQTLAVTIPEMLKIDRDDIEFIISNNHSDDSTKELIASLAGNDLRIKLVEPPQQLPIGKHLDFAYQQAQGEWQGHLGDDDMIFPSRFKILDHIIDQSDALVIRGQNVRYHWPDFLETDLANTLDGRTYTGKFQIETGLEFAAKSLNEVMVHGGGSWIVHRDIIAQVRARCGYFSSPQHVEFFAMRAACAISPQVALIDLPIWIIGRHSKSSGTQALSKKTQNQTWDWSFEDPDIYQYCPLQYKGYGTISLDAALSVKKQFPEILGNVEIQWLMWLNCLRYDLISLIQNEQLPPEAENLFVQGLNKLPIKIRLQYFLQNNCLATRVLFRIYNRLLAKFQPASTKSGSQQITSDCFGWPHYLRGERVGIRSILDVAPWVENTFSGFFK